MNIIFVFLKKGVFYKAIKSRVNLRSYQENLDPQKLSFSA